MEFYAYSSNPAPKATSGDATGPRVEPAIVSLLKDHVVKFTSKYLCSYHRSGLLSAVNREAPVCIGKQWLQRCTLTRVLRIRDRVSRSPPAKTHGTSRRRIWLEFKSHRMGGEMQLSVCRTFRSHWIHEPTTAVVTCTEGQANESSGTVSGKDSRYTPYWGVIGSL